ncbi:MAG: methylmalonyl-CoA mutase family protein [Rhizobiaceae bacterium]
MDPSELANVAFGEQSEARWRSLATKAVKGGDLDAVLASSTDDGLPIAAHASRVINPQPVFARKQAGWTVIQRVDDPDVARAATQAKEDVAGGATGLNLVFEGASNAHGYGLPSAPSSISGVLDGIALEGLSIRIETHPNTRSSADWLVDYLRTRKANFGKINLSLGIDPASILASTGRLKMTIEALEASLPQSLAGFFAAGIPGILLEADGRPYHNAGASEAQELGAMLSMATSHLRMFEKARQPISYAADHIGFAIAVDQDQFVSIAKLRALRLLWARVLELASIERYIAPHVHAQTSWRILTRKDAETNILRSTIAAFATAVGGADSLCVLPHTLAHGLPEGNARRIARNTQLVLRDEASTGFVDDPVAGAGSIEQLTSDLCEAAWEEFKQLESEGGLLRSLAANLFQIRIASTEALRQAEYESKQRNIIGTTVFAVNDERPVAVLQAERPTLKLEAGVRCEALVMRRISEPFEDAGT